MPQTSFKNLRIWDGVSDDYVDASSITITDGRISSIGHRSNGARDCTGLTAVPGLIDAHVHMTLDPDIRDVDTQLNQTPEEIRAKMVVRARKMFEAGITTARDLGAGSYLELELRDQIKHNVLPGPRLLCAGVPVTSIDGHCHFWGGAVADIDAARQVIAQNENHGVDLIKIMATGGMFTKKSHPGRAQFTQDEMTAIVAEANARGFSVAAHCHGTEGIARAVTAGVSTVEHCSWMDDKARRTAIDKTVAKQMSRQATWVSPTINAGWHKFRRGDKRMLKLVRKQFRAMKAAGVPLIASTDAGIPNVRHEDLAKALCEFALYADLTPVETLKSATSEAAKALNIAHLTGRIAQGLEADLLFVDGDPLNNLQDLQKTAAVFARGRDHFGR